MPLRHHLYPGNVNWTEEGHNWSWHMKLRDKRGTLKFTVVDPVSGASWVEDQRAFLSSRQRRKMRSRPDMIVKFAHYLEEVARSEGYEDVEVYARANITLNGRPRRLMIDPKRDLTQVKLSVLAADWILPLDVDLPDLMKTNSTP
jgi:hypothetical protein